MGILIVLLFAVLFLLFELALLIMKKSNQKQAKTNKDRKSLLLFWVSIPICFSAGFYLAKYQDWNMWNNSFAIIGLLITIVGLVLRWIAILQLGSAFTVDVAIKYEHKLKTNGLYNTIRHPSYLGLLLIVIGISFALNSCMSVLVMTLPIFAVILYRIKVEETILLNEFGKEYANYIKKTYRIIPGLY